MNSWLYKYETVGYYAFLINCFLLMGVLPGIFTGQNLSLIGFYLLGLIFQSFLIYIMHTNKSYNLYKKEKEDLKRQRRYEFVLSQYKTRLEGLPSENQVKEISLMKTVDDSFKEFPELEKDLKALFHL